MPFIYVPPVNGGGGGIMQETLVTDDQPGTGTNTLNDGEGRFWTEQSTGESYLVLRKGADYKLVELTITL